MILLEPNAHPETINRFIIEIRDGIDPVTAIELVHAVISEGRVSKTRGINHHCHLTSFTVEGIKMHVACILNKNSERFIVYKE